MHEIKPAVLVVDDSANDLELVKIAAKKTAIDVDWRFIEGGAQALSYLAGEGIYSDRTLYPFPRLMIVDLKMPCVSGYDVLAKLAHLRPPKRPFICVMSCNDMEGDAEKFKALGADIVQTKPVDFHALCQMLDRLTRFYCYSNA